MSPILHMELDVEALRAKYREGGRKDDEFRKITLSRSILNRADGSAKVVIGIYVVVSFAIYGNDVAF